MGNREVIRTSKRTFLSLKVILISTYIFLSVLIIIVFSGITSYVAEKVIKEKENRAVISSLTNIDDRINIKLAQYSDLMISLAYEAPTQKLLQGLEGLSNQSKIEFVNEFYSRMYEVNVTQTDINAIVFIDTNGKQYYTMNQNFNTEAWVNNYFTPELQDQVAELRGEIFIDFSGGNSKDHNSVTLISQINALNKPRGTKPIGMMMINIKKGALSSILFRNTELQLTTLVDSQGIVAIDAHKELQGTVSELNKTAQLQKEPSFQTNMNGEDFFVSIFKNDKYHYTLMSRVLVDELYKDVDYIKKIIVYLILFVLCGVVMISFFLSTFLVKPIKELVTLMNRVSHGNLNVRMVKIPSNEIGILANNFNQMVDTLKNSVPLRKERLISKLLLGRITIDEFSSQGAELGVAATVGVNIVVVVIEIHDTPMSDKEFIPIDDIERFLQSRLVSVHSAALLHILDNRRLIVILQEAEMDLIPYLHESLNREKGVPTTFGVSRSSFSYDKIHESYNEALDALHYKHLFEANEIIYINDIQEKDNNYEQLERIEDEIVQAVKFGRGEQLTASTELLFNTFKEQFVSRETMNRSLGHTHLKILKLMSNLGIDLFNADPTIPRLPSLESFNLFRHTHELKQEFSIFLETSAQLIGNKRETRMHETIAKAITIINERYIDGDFSVSTISKELYISENYFSKLFKQETGKNFSQYVTAVRMKEAENLLTLTDLKISEVAAKVGYKDANYFSLSFKGIFGVSPVKYREQHQ
ncbi:putative DNA-binding response regulator [Paenibacillus agaridevorans]|uniref:Putative DNA-binding response regulator n=1 Tax=Paenibacillus agaridevorans TaxID=171404 RepID=A0A2R5EL07_9BACL|nr:putative DNA-binding response regulator [Paenibacillus agaridevorans]